MPRYFIAFDEEFIEAETAKDAVEKFAEDRDGEIGHTFIVIRVDDLKRSDDVRRFRLGAEEQS